MELGNIAPEFTAAGRADAPEVLAAKRRFYRFGWGLFVHYGLFSAQGEGEWQIHDERLDPAQWRARLAPQFRPRPGCIDEWIALAKDAGMRYVCLTTRHHEGFWLGDGFIREYADKARAAGLGVGMYYSVGDWSDPDYRGGPASAESWERFVAKTHAQLRHLMSDFGRIDYLFYDGAPAPDVWGARAINAELRRLQPGLLVTRCQDDDLKSCEQNSDGGAGLWESCYTLNSSWAYHRHDACWKTPQEIAAKLVSIRARGGTMLLNVGPMADGTVQPEAAGILRELGRWVRANAPAFYDVEPVDPFQGACYEWMTQSADDPRTVYFEFGRSWNATRRLVGIGNRVARVFMVEGNRDLPFTQDPATGFVEISGYEPRGKGDMPRYVGVTFEGAPKPVFDPCWACCEPRASGLREKVEEAFPGAATDNWHGFRRIRFRFEGRDAWIVEPAQGPALGRPWTWTMQWADAFVERTGVLDLLARGWRHVHIDTFDRRMDEEGLRASRAFQRFLVERLGFASRARLVGMSWGGFFSVRYAARFPECVARIFLDAPLLTFDGFAQLGAAATPTAAAATIGPWSAEAPAAGGKWSSDPRMPLNMAEALAAARIPVLLLYGGQDATVPPALNCEPFAARLRAAGGEIEVVRRDLFGHHPHGLDPGATAPISDFLSARP